MSGIGKVQRRPNGKISRFPGGKIARNIADPCSDCCGCDHLLCTAAPPFTRSIEFAGVSSCGGCREGTEGGSKRWSDSTYVLNGLYDLACVRQSGNDRWNYQQAGSYGTYYKFGTTCGSGGGQTVHTLNLLSINLVLTTNFASERVYTLTADLSSSGGGVSLFGATTVMAASGTINCGLGALFSNTTNCAITTSTVVLNSGGTATMAAA